MLSKFPNGTLKIGAKVSLSPESRFAHDYEGSANPVGVGGVVAELNCCESWGEGDVLRVNWNNGTWNHYCSSDYDLIAEGEPGYLEV